MTVECPIAVKLFTLAAAKRYGTEYLATTPDFFRSWWHSALEVLGLPLTVWRPYVLRRGGATEHFKQHGNLEATLFKGRWLIASTA